MPQLKQISTKINDASLTGKRNAFKSNLTETYEVYSIYFTDEPQGGHVIYAEKEKGWDFFGYQPAAENRNQTSKHRISGRQFDCL